ncbi:conserved hypothetical protein [Candidatus Nitrotoga sp. M5]|nr:conserved hypothetical protein [Candidatus Nitrotoga sp. M5]
MSSLARMLAILDEFTVETKILTVDDVVNRLGYNRGTAYRYLRELTNSSLLAHVGSAFTLGPKVVEMDYLIRQNDPYMDILQPLMRQLSDGLDCDILLCSNYQGRTVVSHHERGQEHLYLSYSRGRRMPLFLGAPSKLILASLPKAKLRRLFEENIEQVQNSAFSPDWETLYAEIKMIRRNGYAISKSELDQGYVGVSAALATNPPGSLSLIFSASRFELINEKLVVNIILKAASKANDLILQMKNDENLVDWFNEIAKLAPR